MKKMTCSKLLSVLMLWLVIPGALLASEAGYGFRLDSWHKTAVHYLALSGYLPQFSTGSQPFQRSMLYDAVTAVRPGQTGGLLSHYQGLLAQELRLEKQIQALVQNQRQAFELNWEHQLLGGQNIGPKEKLRYITNLSGYAQFQSDFTGYFDFQFDTDGTQDSDYQGSREWKNVAGHMRAAFFQYRREKWSLLLGREYVHWGPGHTGALLTSGYAPALDMIKLNLRLGRFRFEGFNAILGRNENENIARINRFFSGHRLSLRLPLAELAINETILYGGPNEFLHGGYLNPLIPYYLTDVMNVEERQDNVTVCLEATVYWPQFVRWYGQFLVDEYYYEGEPYPNRTAKLAGVDWTRPFGWHNLWLNFEYVRVDRWVYNYENESPWNRLVYYNSLLGHPIGPDADLLQIRPELYLGRNFVLRLTSRYLRRGETRIITSLSTPNEYKRNKVKFPYGTVERTLTNILELEYRPQIYFSIYALAGFETIENQDNASGVADDNAIFKLGVHYRLQRLFAM